MTDPKSYVPSLVDLPKHSITSSGGSSRIEESGDRIHKKRIQHIKKELTTQRIFFLNFLKFPELTT